MKWLETTPQDYDRGIGLLTLGQLRSVHKRIAHEFAQPGDQVLEIGCGTGTLALLIAQRGAHVIGVDVNDLMLDEARRKVAAVGLADRVEFRHLSAARLIEVFEPGSFDLIVSTLTFSEFPPELRRHVLIQARKLLKPGGRLLIADEVVPASPLARLPFYAVRLPLTMITWLLTRTTTHALHDLAYLLEETGFRGSMIASYLGGSLQLWEAIPDLEFPVPDLHASIPRLRHEVTFKTRLMDFYSLFNRLIPPYPKFRTGLYRVGKPDSSSPVLVTGNYELTVRRVVKALDGGMDCWLLVADSRGINVWCSAGGSHFTADDIIAAVKTSPLAQLVDHRALILPQLCACGVDGWRVRQETGWGVHWGPVRARDIPAYLAAQRKKTEGMRWVDFPLPDRLEMTAVMLIFYGLLLSPVLWLFQRRGWKRGLALMSGLSVIYGVAQPWIPGRDGLRKGAALAGLTALMTAARAIWKRWPSLVLWDRLLGHSFLAFFIGAEYQGMNPTMRGEQVNWGTEAVVGTALFLLHRLGRWWLKRGGT